MLGANDRAAKLDAILEEMSMKIVIASCGNLPDWEVDDQALYDVLANRDVEFDIVAWDRLDVDWGLYFV